jgi:Protein of unknown function (DUF2785)
MEPYFWQAIVENDYAVPDAYAVNDLTPELLAYLGSPDPLLRDKYAYMILAHWLVRGVIPPDSMRTMIKSLLPNLKKGLGEQGTDSVFLRSFSALVLATVNKNPYLDDVFVRNLLTEALAYLDKEKDLRGYVEKIGWVHATAHTADLLLVLARSRHLDGNNLAHLLYGIADKMKRQTGYIFVHEEDDRLARAALIALLRPEVTDSIIDASFTRLVAVTELTQPLPQLDPYLHSAQINTKNLLRSAYFQLALSEDLPPRADDLKTRILEALGAFPH